MKKESATKVIPVLREVLYGKRHMSDSMKEKMLEGLADGGKPEEQSPVEGLSDREQIKVKLKVSTASELTH